MVRKVARAASAVMSRDCVSNGAAVKSLAGMSLVPHMDEETTHMLFGEMHTCPDIHKFERNAPLWVPANVRPGKSGE